MLLAKKADASAVQSYIRLQTPIENKSMAPHYASINALQQNMQTMSDVALVI